MTEEVLKAEVAALRELYGELSVCKATGGATLVKLHEAPLPKGCSPARTPVLLVVPPGQGKPVLHVKPGVKLPNGAAPRSTSVVAIEGEEWLQFSYNVTWDENAHSLLQFVAAGLRRFAKAE